MSRVSGLHIDTPQPLSDPFYHFLQTRIFFQRPLKTPAFLGYCGFTNVSRVSGLHIDTSQPLSDLFYHFLQIPILLQLPLKTPAFLGYCGFSNAKAGANLPESRATVMVAKVNRNLLPQPLIARDSLVNLGQNRFNGPAAGNLP